MRMDERSRLRACRIGESSKQFEVLARVATIWALDADATRSTRISLAPSFIKAGKPMNETHAYGAHPVTCFTLLMQ